MAKEFIAAIELGSTNITGIAGKKGFCSINIDKDQMNSEIGFGRRVLQVFEDNNISFEHMPSGIDTVSLVISNDELDGKLDDLIEQIEMRMKPDSIEVHDDIALLAVIIKRGKH